MCHVENPILGANIIKLNNYKCDYNFMYGDQFIDNYFNNNKVNCCK